MAKPVWDHREGAEAHAGSVEEGVADGRGDADDGRFAGPRGGKVLPVEEHGFNYRNIFEARDAIFREGGVQDAAIFEVDGFEERAAEAHDVRAFHLVAKAV